eukprot:2093235-Alexandrium_andersonii.AAC.1
MQVPEPAWFMQQSLYKAQNFFFRGQEGPLGISAANTVKVLPYRANGTHDVAMALHRNAKIAIFTIFHFPTEDGRGMEP